MKPCHRNWCFMVFLSLSFFLFPLSSSAATSSSNTTSLNSLIRDQAFKALVRRRTGTIYQVPLPSNLSGLEASVVRMRSKTLWSRGLNVTSSFQIPPGILPDPYVRRLAVVAQQLGNWSSSYYAVQRYSLASSVVGLLAYDASSNATSAGTTTELDFRVGGSSAPISIVFQEVQLRKGLKCARFGSAGSVYLDDMVVVGVCSARNTGHFAVVAPSEKVSVPPPAEGGEKGKGKERGWMIWVIACGGGVVGLVLVGLVGVGIGKLVRRKKMERMRRKAEEGEALENVWVGGSNIPSAAMVRTKPVLENGSAP